MGLTAAGTSFLFVGGSYAGSSTGATTTTVLGPTDESYLTIINPLGATGVASVTVAFSDTQGQVLGLRTLSVEAGTRKTLSIAGVVGTGRGPLIMAVHADRPILVENPQYFGGSPNVGRHPGIDLAGSPAGASAMDFADVSTTMAGGTAVSTTLFVLNTSSTPLTVTATYYAASGTTLIVQHHVVRGGTVAISVNADTASLTSDVLGVQLRATGGSFVATRISNTTDHLSYVATTGTAAP
jgi:hypothetical protein